MEKIDIKIFKKLGIYSLITGCIYGLISLIPPLMPFFGLFLAPFLGALIPLFLLVKYDGFYSGDNKTYALLGAISGGALCLSYLSVFVVMVRILHFVFKNYFDYGTSFLNLFLFIMFFFMAATVYVSANATIGLIFGIIYRYFKEKQNG